MIPKLNLAPELEIDYAMEQADLLIKKTLIISPKILRHITDHLQKAKGKGIRAALLIRASVKENNLVPKEAVYAAASIEIFHLATLVHDDIIDDAKIRRGVASVQSKFGKKQAVICGDYLFCAAVALLSDIYHPYANLANTFARSVYKIPLGELRQYANAFNLEINFFEYLKIIQGKTAALFYLAAYGGGVLSSYEENVKEAGTLGKFGNYFGMAFQISDDCKDYKTIDITQKSGNIDITNGVVNLPLLLSFKDKPELKTKAREKDYAELIKIVEKIGVNRALDVADRYKRKALKILNKLPAHKKEPLEEILKDI